MKAELEATQARASTVQNLLTEANKRIEEQTAAKKIMVGILTQICIYTAHTRHAVFLIVYQDSEILTLRNKNTASLNKQQATEHALGMQISTSDIAVTLCLLIDCCPLYHLY